MRSSCHDTYDAKDGYRAYGLVPVLCVCMHSCPLRMGYTFVNSQVDIHEYGSTNSRMCDGMFIGACLTVPMEVFCVLWYTLSSHDSCLARQGTLVRSTVFGVGECIATMPILRYCGCCRMCLPLHPETGNCTLEIMQYIK